MDIQIVTPSYKRADNIKALQVFGEELIIACHEFEEAEYKKANPGNRLLIIPDDRRGNMAKVRNFMRDELGPQGPLLMVDDDVREVGYFEGGQPHPVDLEYIKQFLIETAEMAEAVGTVLVGMNLQSDPKFYREYSPIAFLSPVLGPFSFHTKHDPSIRYDERLGLNEDYDFCIQVARRYRKVLRVNKWYYRAGHLTDTGGCAAYRVLDEEKRQAELMLKKWGNKVVRYNFEKSTNPRVTIPIKGI